MSALGNAWLMHHLHLPERRLAIESHLGTRMRMTTRADGSIQNEYPPQYKPEESVAGHLEFALKHDCVDLCLLRDVFLACGPAPVEETLRTHPTGRYARLMGFYYELTTGQSLNPKVTIGGNYFDALRSEQYLVSSTPLRNRRWRLMDNLLGDGRYCPIVRRTAAIESGLSDSMQAELQSLVDEFPPELFQRAADYLYHKETRSTYDIEREELPPPDRARRFVGLLRSAGEGTLTQSLSEQELVERQNLIVDPRYAVPAFRANQNYIGQQRIDYTQQVHYICPPPQFVPSLMTGLTNVGERSAGLHPIARAAVISFGFVFVHPFEDGNGRLHRFLIHDVLHRDGFIAPGVMLPVSATMLRNMRDYDAALEHYSSPIMSGWMSYELDAEGQLTVKNPEIMEGYYRYPDMTRQVEYLIATVGLSIRRDFAEELKFLRGFDAARDQIRNFIDMPDRRLDLLLKCLKQNQGRLSKAKRHIFEEITDAELEKIEAIFAEAFGSNGH